MAATRAFLQYALTDRKAVDLLDWMSDIKVPDEHFFQTLNHNPKWPAPGAFTGLFITRAFKLRGLAQIPIFLFRSFVFVQM